MDRLSAGGFLGLMAFQAKGCGGGCAADYKKGRGWRRKLCRRVASLPLRGRQPFGLRVMDCLSGNAYKVSVMREGS